MRNIRLTIEYDGGRYQGWARLGKNESNNSISNKIIEVLEKMTGEKDIEKIFTGKAAVSEPCDPKGLFLQEYHIILNRTSIGHLSTNII